MFVGGFELLRQAVKISNEKTLYYQLVDDWADKREIVQVMCCDLPVLRIQYLATRTEVFDPEPRYTLLVDPVPRVRLKAAVEATVSGLYGLADVAANFGSKVTQGTPGSFNKLIAWAAKQGDDRLKQVMAESAWYEKVRELRTEWSHHSTVFISHGKDGDVNVIARDYRRAGDRNHFTDVATVTLEEIVAWTQAAVRCVDLYAGYLASNYILPRYNPNALIIDTVRHENGLPRLLPDGRLETQKITIREFLLTVALI